MSNRTFAPNQALFVSASPATGTAATGTLLQLFRVKTYGVDENYTRERVEQIGQTDPVSQEIVAAPSYPLNIDWTQANLYNESGMGFNLDGVSSAFTNFSNGTQLDKNYYVAFSSEGVDAIGDGSIFRDVIGVGNAVVASYQAQGSVGNFPTVNVSLQGLNVKIDTTCSGIDTAAVIPSTAASAIGTIIVPTAVSGLAGNISTLRSDGVVVNIGNTPFGLANFCATSYNLQAQLNLVPNQCLGDRFPNARLITYPIPVTIAVEANLKDLGAGKANSFICNDSPTDIDIQIFQPGCTGSRGALSVGYKITNAKFVSRQFKTDVKSQFTTVSLNFEALCGINAGAGKSVFLMSGSII